MPQGPIQTLAYGRKQGLTTTAPLPLNADGSALQVESVAENLVPHTSLNVTADQLIKLGPGILVSFNVVTAGAAGSLNDSATIGAAAAANAMVTTPAVVGSYQVNMPFTNGLVYKVGAAQVVSINYKSAT